MDKLPINRLPLLRSHSDPRSSGNYGSLSTNYNGDKYSDNYVFPYDIELVTSDLTSNAISFDEFGLFNSASKDHLSSMLNKSMKTVLYASLYFLDISVSIMRMIIKFY